MKYKNSAKTIATPLIIGLSLIIGIVIGYKFLPGSGNTSNFSANSNKLSSVINLVNENYVDKLSTDSLQEVAIVDFLKKLDPHSRYIPAKDMEANTAPLKGNFDGIGIQFNIQNDTILIINTISGGPSEKIGVQAGDRIVMINDSLFAGIGITNDGVMTGLKGERGTSVKISVKRRGESELIDFDITRDKIPLFSIDVSYMITPQTGYIKISRFAGTTHKEFIEHSQKLLKAGMQNLVLDLRQNGGGYLGVAVNIADEFLAKNKMIVYTKGASRSKTVYNATESGSCEDIKLAILIDAWSASASEIVAGAIQDNDRGQIIGKRSFGKGLVQEPVPFADGSGVRLTTSRYYTPTGRCIQKPYSTEEDYHGDIYKRAANGEFNNVDSTHFADSLKYTTPEGRIVYGGGGIMPDIFVPTDTLGYSTFYSDSRNNGKIYQFGLYYADKHRSELSKFKDYKSLDTHLHSLNIFNKFTSFSNAKPKTELTEKQLVKITTELHAYISRNIIDDEGFYPILNKDDVDIKKTIIALEGK